MIWFFWMGPLYFVHLPSKHRSFLVSTPTGIWERHPEVSEMMSVQQRGLLSATKLTTVSSSGSDSDSEDDDATDCIRDPQENKFVLLSTTTE